MANLWGGRFSAETDKQLFEFNASFKFDKRLIDADIAGSIAHAKMLHYKGLLTKEEKDSLETALKELKKEVDEKGVSDSDLKEYEDVHSFIEAYLTNKCGKAGKKIHTGRSRNDQVALDMRLFTKNQAREVSSYVIELKETILSLMKEHIDTYMPGFTHLQKAQPITLAHHLGAYYEMFSRDLTRLSDALRRLDECPLGAGALAGSSLPIDRIFVSDELDFLRPCANTMDAVSDRDYLIELLAAFSIIMMHLSRFCEELIIWNSNEYQFIEIADEFATGSSIMPQKKNPDIPELIRGKTGRVYGHLMALLTTMKALPLAYNKDMQEDKEGFFDALDTTKSCLSIFNALLNNISFNKERMSQSAQKGFANATDVAEYLVEKGAAFRDAHEIVGRLVVYCIENGKDLEGLTLEEYYNVGLRKYFEKDIFDYISLKNCVGKRNTYGGPSPEAVRAHIALSELNAKKETENGYGEKNGKK